MHTFGFVFKNGEGKNPFIFQVTGVYKYAAHMAHLDKMTLFDFVFANSCLPF